MNEGLRLQRGWVLRELTKQLPSIWRVSAVSTTTRVGGVDGRREPLELGQSRAAHPRSSLFPRPTTSPGVFSLIDIASLLPPYPPLSSFTLCFLDCRDIVTLPGIAAHSKAIAPFSRFFGVTHHSGVRSRCSRSQSCSKVWDEAYADDLSLLGGRSPSYSLPKRKPAGMFGIACRASRQNCPRAADAAG
ncbi:hypothetical protein LZ32DRAFT_402520 [Colletotrichum eremochloae]|nr:hypothetical protein LZ32DRAFT_402520 [Colletotrichum eremochloae]